MRNSGVWGLKLAKSVFPRVVLVRGPPRGGVHYSGVWSLPAKRTLLERARRVGEYTETCEKRVLLGSAGEGPAAPGQVTILYRLGPEVCEKRTPTRAAGEGHTARGNSQFGRAQ